MEGHIGIGDVFFNALREQLNAGVMLMLCRAV